MKSMTDLLGTSTDYGAFGRAQWIKQGIAEQNAAAFDYQTRARELFNNANNFLHGIDKDYYDKLIPQGLKDWSAQFYNEPVCNP